MRDVNLGWVAEEALEREAAAMAHSEQVHQAIDRFVASADGETVTFRMVSGGDDLSVR